MRLRDVIRKHTKFKNTARMRYIWALFHLNSQGYNKSYHDSTVSSTCFKELSRKHSKFKWSYQSHLAVAAAKMFFNQHSCLLRANELNFSSQQIYIAVPTANNALSLNHDLSWVNELCGIFIVLLLCNGVSSITWLISAVFWFSGVFSKTDDYVEDLLVIRWRIVCCVCGWCTVCWCLRFNIIFDLNWIGDVEHVRWYKIVVMNLGWTIY